MNEPDASLAPTSCLEPTLCVSPTYFVDSDDPDLAAYAERVAGDTSDPLEKARRLYLAIRDDVRYDPYRLGNEPEDFKASSTLKRRYGFCVTKAALLTAVARAQGIPARLGFADVRNHLTSPRLRKAMGTDVFVFHGYTEFYLNDRWVKATPAFNKSLCLLARIVPLEFDGVHDSIYHPFDADGRQHMEYLEDRGVYLDIPFDEMVRVFRETYGEATENWMSGDWKGGRFEEEVETSRTVAPDP